MTQKSLSFQDLNISFDAVCHQMGYADAHPSSKVSAMTKDMMRHISEAISPRFAFITTYAALQENTIIAGDVHLHVGKIIARQLEGSEAFAIFVATAGAEMQQFLRRLAKEGDMVGSFIADAIGSVVAERCADLMEETLQQAISKLGWRHTNRFSPGYCQWDVSEQFMLFRLLGDAPCGVTLNAQSMMTPEKSVSGIIGLGSKVQHLDYSCGHCDLSHCQFRKR